MSDSSEYQKRWAAANPEKYPAYRAARLDERAAYNRAWRAANLDRARAQAKVRYKRTRAVQLARGKAWSQANAPARNALTMQRKAAKLRAVPAWLTPMQHEEIAEWYRLAVSVGKHVDHIIPLQNPLVCGLHVPWNLQLLSLVENSAKGNRFDPDDDT